MTLFSMTLSVVDSHMSGNTFKIMHIVHNPTRGMSYISMLFYSILKSLASRREDVSLSFFLNVLTPDSCLHSLLRPPRPPAVGSRLRSSQTFPKLYTRMTQRYCSFIHHGLGLAQLQVCLINLLTYLLIHLLQLFSYSVAVVDKISTDIIAHCNSLICHE